jgi:hypothetical protein
MKLPMPSLVITTCLTHNYSTVSFFNPGTDSRQFQNLATAARHRLKNYDLPAQLATLDAVTKGTTAKQACYWGYCQTYLKAIELDDDPFLSTFS